MPLIVFAEQWPAYYQALMAGMKRLVAPDEERGWLLRIECRPQPR